MTALKKLVEAYALSALTWHINGYFILYNNCRDHLLHSFLAKFYP